MKTNKSGISLIVLAITIIVMIILATAIILSLSSNNVANTAKEAANASDVANAKHAVAVAKGEWELGEVEGYVTFKAYAEAKLIEAGFKTSGNGGINVSETGAVTTIYIDKDNAQVLIPEGYVASDATGENKISTGLVIYQGTEPVTDKNVKEAKRTRNQFVWVPVENMSRTYSAAENSGTGLVTESEFNASTSYNPISIDEEVEYITMKESVSKYGGFYIARYETGIEGSNTAVSKQYVMCWSAINWKAARNACTSLGTDAAVGHLIYAEEWEAAIDFIEKVTPSYGTDSTGKGNYDANGTDTGIKNDYSLSNIYDMAGNIYEWTMEYSSTAEGENRIARGGSYDANGIDRTGSTFPAACRVQVGANDATNTNIGFRMALYLK